MVYDANFKPTFEQRKTLAWTIPVFYVLLNSKNSIFTSFVK